MHAFLFLLLVFAASIPSLPAQEGEAAEFFEKRVRPVLANKCQACHNSGLKTGGLDLSSAEGFAMGGQSGPVVSSEAPAKSRILEVIRYQQRVKMPPGGMLPEDEIDSLAAWVETGAHWPGVPDLDEPAADAEEVGGFHGGRAELLGLSEGPGPGAAPSGRRGLGPVSGGPLRAGPAGSGEPASGRPGLPARIVAEGAYDLTGCLPARNSSPIS